jgi:DNA polymerase-3 subunit alpha
MASVSNHSGNIEKITFFMEECKRMGIKVLGPDVNEGFGKFSVMPNGNIRFGMASIKGVGENVVTAIVEERLANGKFKSVFDLAARLDSKAVNKKSLEGLALAGAFDSFENVHRAMFFVPDLDGSTLTEKIIRYGNQKNLGNDTSQASLFGGEDEIEVSEPVLPKMEPWTALEQLAREKEVVGFYISGHPLDPYKLVLEHRCNANCAQLKSGLEPFKNKEVFFGGIISGNEVRDSKTGNKFGKIIIEDYNGSFEIMLFGNDFRNFITYTNVSAKGLFVFIKARVQERYNQSGSLELKINNIELLEEVKKKAFSSIKLKVKLDSLNNELVQKLEAIINQHGGQSSVEFFVEDEIQNQNIKLFSKKSKVAVEDSFLMELDKLMDIKYDLA